MCVCVIHHKLLKTLVFNLLQTTCCVWCLFLGSVMWTPDVWSGITRASGCPSAREGGAATKPGWPASRWGTVTGGSSTPPTWTSTRVRQTGPPGWRVSRAQGQNFAWTPAGWSPSWLSIVLRVFCPLECVVNDIFLRNTFDVKASLQSVPRQWWRDCTHPHTYLYQLDCVLSLHVLKQKEGWGTNKKGYLRI